MPELPDLVVYCGNLKKLVLGRTIVDAWTPERPSITDPFVREKLRGAQFNDIVRNGKELFFSLSNGHTLSVHLMLFGVIDVVEEKQIKAVKGKLLAVTFDDGRAMTIADTRRQCRIAVNPKMPGTPDALSASFTFGSFKRKAARNPLTSVKGFLLDQHVVRGIGNAYADEILWKADISPVSIMSKIPEDRLLALFEAIPEVLQGAIERILEISPNRINGEERSFLEVHNPEKTSTADGEPILVREVAGRKTYFTQKQVRYL